MPGPRSSVFICTQGHIWPAAGETGESSCPECGSSAKPFTVVPTAIKTARPDPLRTAAPSDTLGPPSLEATTPDPSSQPIAAPAAKLEATDPAATPIPETVVPTSPWPTPIPPRSGYPRGGLPSAPGYTILGELGRGAMGVVYKARHEKLKRVVALKMIRGDSWGGEQFLTRFQVEAEAVARLHHPHIVQIYEVGEQDGRPFLALEFVTGGTLGKRLGGKPQPIRAAVHLVEMLARAMQAAHLRGIVHRDLKPANILLEPTEPARDWGGLMADQLEAARLYGMPKINDFGLAKRIDDHSDPSSQGDVIGTPMYMAPEQARGETEDVGPSADIYALGAILYEMLTGRPPFQARSVAEVLERVAHEAPVSPRRLRRQLPRDLEAICLICLQKEPRLRYPSAVALADDLQRFLEGRPILARPTNPLTRLWGWSLRYPIVASLLMAVTVVLGVGQWQLRRLSNDIVARTALASAGQQTATLQKMYKLYAGVAGRVRDAGTSKVILTHEYPSVPHSIPIPARFTIMLGEEMEALAESETGSDQSAMYSKLHVYSNYPFRYRPGNPPPHGSFGSLALKHFQDDPEARSEPFFRIETDRDDRQLMRYATAFVMERSCLGCHNDRTKYDAAYQESARVDWKKGDVRGVLVIDVPLTREYRQTDDEIFGTYLLLAGIGAAAFALTWLGLTIGRRYGR